MRIVAIIMLLSSCSLKAGLGVHTYNDRPEINLKNPLITIGAEKNLGSYRVTLEHTSSLPEEEMGAGINQIKIEKIWQ